MADKNSQEPDPMPSGGAEAIQQRAEQHIAEIVAKKRACIARHSHGYGCSHDGDLVSNPLPVDCRCEPDPNLCKWCDALEHEITLVRDLLAQLAERTRERDEWKHKATSRYTKNEVDALEGHLRERAEAAEARLRDLEARRPPPPLHGADHD